MWLCYKVWIEKKLWTWCSVLNIKYASNRKRLKQGFYEMMLPLFLTLKTPWTFLHYLNSRVAIGWLASSLAQLLRKTFQKCMCVPVFTLRSLCTVTCESPGIERWKLHSKWASIFQLSNETLMGTENFLRVIKYISPMFKYFICINMMLPHFFCSLL